MINPSVHINFTPRFLKRLKELYKKYPHVREDVKELTDLLERGETPGDQIQGVSYPVYKVRVKSSDMLKGKSGGYRVIYYLRTATHLILVTLYAKAEMTDINPDEIRRIIEDYEPPSE